MQSFLKWKHFVQNLLFNPHKNLPCGALLYGGCDSFYFYIKPQLFRIWSALIRVVTHSISTSNHNLLFLCLLPFVVVTHSISTSNHNKYIADMTVGTVVTHSISTSNHNKAVADVYKTIVVTHSISTSNHNYSETKTLAISVVTHSISTSNHNTIHMSLLI